MHFFVFWMVESRLPLRVPPRRSLWAESARTHTHATYWWHKRLDYVINEHVSAYLRLDTRAISKANAIDLFSHCTRLLLLSVSRTGKSEHWFWDSAGSMTSFCCAASGARNCAIAKLVVTIRPHGRWQVICCVKIGLFMKVVGKAASSPSPTT